MPKKIELPNNPEQKDYVIYLYKNKNKFHHMNDKDINNLIKLFNYGKLEQSDYPVFKKKQNKVCNKLNGYCFNNFDHSYSQI